MERKRKLPARAARADSVSKKKILKTSALNAPTQTSEPQPVVFNERTPLPTSIVSGKSLPTVSRPQPTDLSLKDYQSIPESGVLSESLHRSRQKWTSEGIFEKYWTKIRKGKNTQGEPPGNPPKDSMIKLGTCTIIVEPHIFDATLYTVKVASPRIADPKVVPMSRPVLQYGPPNTDAQSESIIKSECTSYKPPETNSLDMNKSETKLVVNDQETHIASSNIESNSSKPNLNTNSIKCNKHPENTKVIPATEIKPVSRSADPVIQMLAQRAATDADLQYLMGKVANGQATTEQLKKFQCHINEVTTIQLERKEQQRLKKDSSKTSSTCPNGSVTAPPKILAQTQSSIVYSSDTTQSSQNITQSPAIRPEESLNSNKHDVASVVLEFSNGNGDRYSFPKYSILEFIPSTNQVIVSFLIIRKGSDAESPSYNPKLDYYQPMTIRLYVHQTRLLDALQKAVETPDKVHEWMNKVMEECQRAEYVLLAMRLPREINYSNSINMENKFEKNNHMNAQVNWKTTQAPQAKTKVKSPKKMETEEAHYDNYIKSIAAIT
ncbi:hypothetical protein HI914_05850 [Erysiphe necator]|nr:hypothetical protein HI914_05850 [Erysiphe necator]